MDLCQIAENVETVDWHEVARREDLDDQFIIDFLEFFDKDDLKYILNNYVFDDLYMFFQVDLFYKAEVLDDESAENMVLMFKKFKEMGNYEDFLKHHMYPTMVEFFKH